MYTKKNDCLILVPFIVVQFEATQHFPGFRTCVPNITWLSSQAGC